MKGSDIIAKAKSKVGSKYVLGVVVPKDASDYKGAFDCAEYVAWVLYQVTDKLYGCSSNKGKPATADAWTNFFKRDGDNGTLTEISVAEALRTPGAILLRYTASGSMGHIIFSDGKGGSVEAHSTKRGVIESTATGRRFDVGLLVPGVTYLKGNAVQNSTGVTYRYIKPMMKADIIETAQAKLKLLGFDPLGVDGWYGAGTQSAVASFQQFKGLVPDGEMGDETLRELGIIC